MLRLGTFIAFCAVFIVNSGCGPLHWVERTAPLVSESEMTISKSPTRHSFRVLVKPLINNVATSYALSDEEGQSDITISKREATKAAAMSSLYSFILLGLREAELFDEIIVGGSEGSGDATLQITVEECLREEQLRIEYPYIRSVEGGEIKFRLKAELLGSFDGLRRDYTVSHFEPLAHGLLPSEEDDLVKYRNHENSVHASSLMNDLVAQIANDPNVREFAKSVVAHHKQDLPGNNTISIRFIKPLQAETLSTRQDFLASVVTKQPETRIRVLLNGQQVASFPDSDSASKGVVVRPDSGGVSAHGDSDEITSLSMSSVVDGVSISGVLMLDAGRNLIEIIAQPQNGQPTKETLLITRLGGESVDHRPVGQRWAVLVGVDSYAHASKGIANLRFASRDARSIYDFLQSPQGGAFPASHMRLLINEQATTAAVREAIFDFLAEAQENDFVVIYLSCHGAPAPGRPDNLYIITHDTDPDKMASTAVPMWDIETALKRQIRADRVLVLADSCHSAGVGGTPGARGDANLINKFVQQLAETKPGRAIFTASEANEQSFEGEEYGGGHGAFTHFLLEGLNGAADEDSSGTVTLGEAVDYTREKVRRATKGKQHPDTAGNFDRSLPLSVLK